MKYLLLLLPFFAQAQPFDFVQKIEGTRTEVITDMCVFKNSDYVATGIYEDPSGAVFQSQDGKNVTIPANQDTFKQSHSTLFVARYDKKGGLKWVANAFAENGIHPWDMAIDSAGNTIVCGNFRGLVTFNSTDKKTSRTFKGVEKRFDGWHKDNPLNYFIAKYNKNGVLLWAKIGLSDDHSVAFQAETDAQNNIYVRAYCHANAISFDTYSVLPNKTSYLQSYNFIIVKYNPNGEEAWVTFGGSRSSIFPRWLSINKAGNPVCRVSVHQNITLFTTNGKYFDKKCPNDATTYDIEMAAASGEIQEVREVKSLTGNEGGFTNVVKSVTNDANEQYVLLKAQDPGFTGKKRLVWKDSVFIETDKNIYLAKADKNNKPQWIIKIGTPSRDEDALDICLDKKGNILVSGWTGEDLEIQGVRGKTETLAVEHKGLIAMFVASFSPKGELNWVQYFGSTWQLYRSEPVLKLCVSPENKLLVHGQIDTPISFGKLKLDGMGALETQPRSAPDNIKRYTYTDAFISCLDLKKMPSSGKDKQPEQTQDTTTIADTKSDTKADTKAEEPLVAVEINDNSVLLFPNPVAKETGIVNLQLTAAADCSVTWAVIDANAKQLLTNTENVAKGVSLHTISFKDYPAGVYFVVIQVGTTQFTKRVVVV
jgi:Secretion system C-terminal sorting domain